MSIKALIERNKDGYYFITSDDTICNCVFGGNGSNLQMAMSDFELSIEEMKSIAIDCGKEWPEEEITVEYIYDLSALFAICDSLNISRFAQLSGINASKMRAYSSGSCKPSKSTKLRIQSALHKLGNELSSIKLY